MNQTSLRGVAAFDFDGTIAKGDSLIPFLRIAVGTPEVIRTALKLAPQLLKVKLTNSGHGTTKEKFISSVLAGKDFEAMSKVAESYARLMESTKVFTATRDRIQWHKQHNHQVVMVSASPDIYLNPMAELLGIDHAITTRLEVVDGTITGRFIGNNVRDAEKKRLLNKFLGDEQVELWAYGNSDGDKQLLAMADHPHWVSKRGRITKL